MITALLGAIGGWELAMLAGPVLSKLFIKKSVVDTMLYGTNKPIEIRFLDGILAKQVGEVTWLQRKSHEKFVYATRRIVNTKAFELVTLRILKDRWAIDKWMKPKFIKA